LANETRRLDNPCGNYPNALATAMAQRQEQEQPAEAADVAPRDPGETLQ
jgi:hypothetical protein